MKKSTKVSVALFSFFLFLILSMPVIFADSGNNGVYTYSVSFYDYHTTAHSVVSNSGSGYPIGSAYAQDANDVFYSNPTYLDTGMGYWTARIDSHGPKMTYAQTCVNGSCISKRR